MLMPLHGISQVVPAWPLRVGKRSTSVALAPDAPELSLFAVVGDPVQLHSVLDNPAGGDVVQTQITDAADTSFASPEIDSTGTLSSGELDDLKINAGLTGLTPGDEIARPAGYPQGPRPPH
jgi:hypothetical protein